MRTVSLIAVAEAEIRLAWRYMTEAYMPLILDANPYYYTHVDSSLHGEALVRSIAEEMETSARSNGYAVDVTIVIHEAVVKQKLKKYYFFTISYINADTEVFV